MRTLNILVVLGFLNVLTVGASAWSQQPDLDPQRRPLAGRPAAAPRSQPPAPGETEEPQSTSASFGDWVERCQKVQTGSESLRVCEAAQTILAAGQNGPVAELAIGRLRKTEPLRVTLVLPVNVGFPSAPKLVVEGKPAETIELAWRRCVPGGCVADAVISDSVLALWRAETVQGHIEGTTGASQAFQVTFSFKGFGQALAALAREDQ